MLKIKTGFPRAYINAGKTCFINFKYYLNLSFFAYFVTQILPSLRCFRFRNNARSCK